MSAQQESHSASYLYAILRREEALPQEPSGRYKCAGHNDGGVYCVLQGSVAAVVSDVPERRFRPERRHLAAHQQVLRYLIEEGRSLLPVSFGIVATDAGALRGILSSNEETFCEQLQRVEGKVEMGLRVMWDIPNIFQHFVDTHPELKGLRDRLFRGAREPTQDEKIALGGRFEQLLQEDRAAHTESVCEVLERASFEVKDNEPQDENEVMNLACLIGREGQKGFEEAVLEAAKLFDDNYAFDYNGPWPPYNFVDVELET